MRRDVSSTAQESQASRIIGCALGAGASPAASRTKVHSKRQSSEDPDERIEEDNVDSRSTGPRAHPYHFFGLASTQTASQIYPEEGDASQKENLEAAARKQVKESSRPIKSQIVKERPPPRQLPPSSPTRARTNFTQGPSRYHPDTRRSPMPRFMDSQDSFAGGYNDDSDRYPADQFEVPLSQLERVAEEREAAANLRKSRRRQIIRSPSPQVLVQATPSASQESITDNPPPQVDDLEGVTEQNRSPSPASQATSVFSEGYVQFWNNLGGNLHSENPAPTDTPMPVELDHPDVVSEGYSATQPATQLAEFVGDKVVYPLLRLLWKQTEHPALSVEANRLMTFVNPHSAGRYISHVSPLFDMAKDLGVFAKWRAVAIAQVSGEADADREFWPAVVPVAGEQDGKQASDAPHSRQPSPPGYQETQVAEAGTGSVDATQPTTVEDVAPRRRGFPPRIRAFPPKLAPPNPAPPADDPMDTVPDSEPLRAEVSPPYTASTRPVPSPTKKIFRPISPDPHPASGEIVPDSIEVDQAMEDNDSDDAPLAKVAPMLNKGKEVNGIRSADMAPPMVSAASKAKGKQRATSPEPLSAATRFSKSSTRMPVVCSWDTGFVPSSVPEQDGVTEEVPKPTAPTKARATRTTRSKPTPVASSSKRKIEAVRENLTPLSDVDVKAENDNEGTEPADDDEEYEDPVKEEKTTKKRKRAPTSKPKSTTATKSATKRTKRAKKTDAPPATRAKSLRSSVPASSSKHTIDSKPTRVFAFWKSDGHYYVGMLHSMSAPGRYLVKFDDGTEASVTLDQMRTAELKVGDEVLVSFGTKKSKPCKVINVDDQDTTDQVTLNIQGGEEVVEKKHIYIHMKTVNSTWNDRRLTIEELVTKVKPPAPSPSRLSVGPNVRVKSDALSGIGIVITLATKPETSKEEIAKIVRSGMGVVVDDWSNVISLGGTYDEGNHRWVITQDEIQWIGDLDVINKIFLVSDEVNEKPRYLMAIALGIPCISYKWLKACIAEKSEVEWSPYLLPQGFVEALEAHVSQFVDLFWCASTEHLRKITMNKVPPKVMKGKSILCLGRELIPAHGKTDVPGSHFIGQIMMCMGAKRVEAVSNLSLASKEAARYDFVVVKEGSEYGDELDGATVVDTQWVKWSVIAGRILTLPEWSRP